MVARTTKSLDGRLRVEGLEPRLAMTAASLALTEIMYHPAPPSAAETAAGFSEADFDFVEFQNTQAEPLSLAGFTLSGGIEFDFGDMVLQSGGHIVVARDVEAFAFRYGTVVPVAGAYSGSLGNNGEEIELADGTGAVLFSFTFDDDWHPATDGDGYSLVLAEPTSDPITWTQGAAWMASNSVFGSPGRSDGPFDASPPGTPQGLSANLAAGSSVELAWGPATDLESGVAQYRVYRNGRFLAGTAATQFSDLSVPANATYTYTVSAVNASLIEGERSAPATVSLPHVGDQPAFAPAQVAGVVEGLGRETSGIVGSRRNPDVFWVHNDGAAKKVVAINTFGRVLGTLTLSDIVPVDVEDIAIGAGPVPGQSYLYLSDIGDNDATRTSITIYRVPEPSINAQSTADQSSTLPGASIETITLRYPGAAVDAETLLVDPLTGDVYVIVKENGASRVFQTAGASLVNGANVVLSLAGMVSFSEPSAGDISPTGREILLRNEDQARLYVRGEGQSVMAALAGRPLVVPVVGTPTEPNGEGITFDGQGNHYYTISEGRDPSLYYFHRTSRSPGGSSAIAGDLDSDGRVTLRDLVILRNSFGMTSATSSQGDLDGNGTVDRTDLSLFAQNYGRTAGSPSAAAQSVIASATLRSPASRNSGSGDSIASTLRASRHSLGAKAVDQALSSGSTLTAGRTARRHR
jgi:hypothetical protein